MIDDAAIVALSLRVAAVAVFGLLPLATLVAWSLARLRFPGKLLVEALVDAPLVVPPVVTGYLLLQLFGRQGPLGGLGLTFTWWGAALASAVVAFPLAVRALRVAFGSIDPKLEAAARSLGAGPWRCFFSITLPLARSGFVAAALLAFARALGEFGATITFAGNVAGETQTLPLAIYGALQRPSGEGMALRLVGWSVALSLGALVLGQLWERRHR